MSSKPKPKTPEHVTYSPDGLSATIELGRSYTFGGESRSNLVMRRPRLRDRRAVARMSESSAEMEIFLFANLCEVTDGELEELFETDYSRVQDAYVGFSSRS